MLYLIFGAVVIAVSPILVKSIELSPTMIGAYRCLLGAFFLSPIFFRISWRKLSKHAFFLILLTSFFFALDILAWHRSVKLAGAGIGTILANTQVFYLGLLGYLIYRDRLSLRFLSGIILGFFGVLLIANVITEDGLKSFNITDDLGLGVVWGLVTGLFYTAYIFFMRKVRSELEDRLSAIELLSLVSLFTGLILLLVAAFEGSTGLPVSLESWLYVLLLGGLVQVLGWYLVSTGLPMVEVGKAGLLLLIQPTLATLLGAILLQERMSLFQVVGAIATVVGVGLGVTAKSEKQA